MDDNTPEETTQSHVTNSLQSVLEGQLYKREAVYDLDASKPFTDGDRKFAEKYGSADQPQRLALADVQILERMLCTYLGVQSIKSTHPSRSGNKISFMDGSVAKYAVKHDKAFDSEERPFREIGKSCNFLRFLNNCERAGFSAHYAFMHLTARKPHWIISRALDGGCLGDKLQEGLTRKETLDYLVDDFYQEYFFDNLKVVQGQTKAVTFLELYMIAQYIEASDLEKKYDNSFASEDRTLKSDLKRISDYVTSSEGFGELPVTLSITDPAKTNLKFLELPDEVTESELTEGKVKVLRLNGRRYMLYLLDQGLADDVLAHFECPQYIELPLGDPNHIALPQQKWMAHLQPAEASMARLEEMTRLYKLSEPIADLVAMMETRRDEKIKGNVYAGVPYPLKQEQYVTRNTQHIVSELAKMEICTLLYRESKGKNEEAYNSFVGHMQNILSKIKG